MWLALALLLLFVGTLAVLLLVDQLGSFALARSLLLGRDSSFVGACPPLGSIACAKSLCLPSSLLLARPRTYCMHVQLLSPDSE